MSVTLSRVSLLVLLLLNRNSKSSGYHNYKSYAIHTAIVQSVYDTVLTISGKSTSEPAK